MSTSTDSTGGQESESIITVIPWSCVNYCIINELVQLLNPISAFGQDWKGLASHLGYSFANIAAIESGKQNNTEELFKAYARKPNASFNEVYTSLEKLKRQDCLDVLIKHYDEIKRAYHQQRQQPSSSSFHLSGGEMQSPSSGRYVCGDMSQPIAGPPHSPHACCSIDFQCTGTHLDHCSLQAQPPIGQIPPSQTPIPAPGYFPSHLQINIQFNDGSLHNHSTNSPPNSQYQNISDPSGGRQPLSMMSQNPEPGYRMERSVRGTRLFVTYSYSPDTEQHRADVILLLEFLEENNFKPYADVKDVLQTRENDNRDDYLSRFEAADHILMCVSPTYLRDTSEIDPLASNERQLHTRQIYKWMHQEHLNNLQMEQARQRAIILLFDSVTSDALPDWMKEYPMYKWPTEYEDLFWILMNPEDKVKAKCNGASS